LLAWNYKQHILSTAEVRKVCYSLDELYVKSVHLNLFWWREVHETFEWGRKLQKVWEPVV
jgi:hypothetical protein